MIETPGSMPATSDDQIDDILSSHNKTRSYGGQVHFSVSDVVHTNNQQEQNSFTIGHNQASSITLSMERSAN